MKTFRGNLCRALALVGAIVALAVSEGWAVRPYTPVHPDPVLESWRWRSFPELNGLGLKCMAEAKDKSMWFGVDDGVRRYDGIHWTPYTEKDGLYGAPVQALCPTQDGSVYAGTPMGISRFQDGKWSRAFPPEGGLPWPIYKLMEAKDGSLWSGTEWGALRLSREGATLYTTKETGDGLRTLASYIRISIVPDTAVPVRAWKEGIGVEIWSSFQAVRSPDVICALAPGGPGETAGLKVGDRIVAADGQALIQQDRLDGLAGTSVRLRVKREGRSDPFEVTVARRKVEGTYRGFPIYDVYEDREGRMWFGIGGSDGGEIVRYAPSAPLTTHDSEWRLYTEKDGLDIGWGPRIIQTRDGTIWTVSRHGVKGVNRFIGRTWIHFYLSDLGGVNANPSVLETRDGTLWVGGVGSLHACRNGVWRVYKGTEAPIPGTYVIGLVEASDGALWLEGSHHEVARLEPGTSRWNTFEGLVFQCETLDGAQWFLAQDNGLVRYDGRGWTRYGVEDGLMDAPVALIATRQGVLWAAGSHDSTAATARFDREGRWSLQAHPRLSWGVTPNLVFESSDGSLWLGSYVSPFSERGQLGGMLRVDGKTWTHYTPPDALPNVYGIGQTADGMLWFGSSSGLRRFDGRTWTPITDPEDLTKSGILAMSSDLKGDLWVGTMDYGLFHYAGKNWTRYDTRDGLADNGSGSILQTVDGSVWAGTGKGISRFDGRAWTTHALPSTITIGSTYGQLLRQSRDGALWIIQFSGFWGGRAFPSRYIPPGADFSIRTIRYQPDASPPETEITVSLDRVSQPGNTVLAWKGGSPWKATPDEEIQYSYRMDGGEWSPFSLEKNHIFQAMPSGRHTFEVRARDRDFNVDPTPASIRFTVVPPVWRQPWFIVLVLSFAGITGFQASRIVLRDRKLREANMALSSANKELFGLNRELQESNEQLGEANRKLDASNRQIQEATQRKSAFLASMSHELRTPMNAIIGFTRLVLRRGAEQLSERHRENLQKVSQSADQLLNLIDDILDLSKVEAGRLDVRPSPFQVRNLVASCCAAVSPLVKPGVTLGYEVPEDIGEANTDEARLRQILINLLGNALKFTEKGEVRVKCHVSSATQNQTLGTWHLERGTGAEDGMLVVAVSDTGVGIPPDALDTIFEEFRQVKGSTPSQGGTGLGLAITKKLVELLGGTISVESELGKGSTFAVRIPLVYSERTNA